jgi:hypothetical protein
VFCLRGHGQLGGPVLPSNLDPKIFAILSGPNALSIAQYFGLPLPTPQHINGILGAIVDPSVLYTYQVTNDSQKEVEPAVLSLTIGGIDHTSSVYIRYPNGIVPRLFFSHSTNLVDWSSPLEMRRPLFGYTQSVDSLMAANIYTNGIAPLRLYCVGLLKNDYLRDPSAITAWYSDDGGQSWSYPTTVDSRGAGDFLLDKPAIATSLAPDSRGYVHVSYTNAYTPEVGRNEIVASRSTDGGITFSDTQVLATGTLGGSQVLVHPYLGNNVYVIWLDYANGVIRMRQSSDYGVHWGVTVDVATFNPMVIDPQNQALGVVINGPVRAQTVLMARYNSVANRICIVWHERQSSSPPNKNITDVYYTSNPGGVWQGKVLLNAQLPGDPEDYTRNDQFMPALDFDTSGNVLVTWYDRKDDSGNILYHQYLTYVTSDGLRLQAPTRVSSFQSNPMAGPQPGFVGDYQDVWDWTFSSGEKYHNVWVGIPTSTDIANIYVSGIH